MSGSTATLDATEDAGSGAQYRWNATITMGSSPSFQYTCIVDDTGQTEPPLNTNQPFDYSVFTGGSLVLLFPDSAGSSAGFEYDLVKQ